MCMTVLLVKQCQAKLPAGFTVEGGGGGEVGVVAVGSRVGKAVGWSSSRSGARVEGKLF